MLSSVNINNSPNLTELYLTNSRLTYIDVSKNTELKILALNNNQLMSLDFSNNIKIENVWLSNNGLSSLALDNLFQSLPNVLPIDPHRRHNIIINRNSGAADSDFNIAEEKGWIVHVSGALNK